MVYFGTCVLRYVDFKTVTNTVMVSFVGFCDDDHFIRNVLTGEGILFDERPAFEKNEQLILFYSLQFAFRSSVFHP